MDGPIPEKVVAIKLRWLVLALSALVALVGFVVVFWQLETPSLLPDAVWRKVTAFTPYFSTRLPAGYSLDRTHITSEAGLLMIPLTGPGGTVTISEQPMDETLTQSSLQGQGDRVDGVSGFATINNVEDRLVGIYVSPDKKTLVLLNESGSGDKAALEGLIRSLKPVR